MHAGVIVVPIALYFYAAQPAWSWLYAVDPASVTKLAWLPLVVAHGGLVVGGWYLGARLLRSGRTSRVWYCVAALALIMGVAILLCRHRLLASASFAGFHAGLAMGIFKAKLGFAVLVAALSLIGSTAFVLIELAGDSRRVRSR